MSNTKISPRYNSWLLCGAVCIGTLTSPGYAEDMSKGAQARLSPTLPADVNIAEKKKLEAVQNFAGVQRLFDEVSWQSFVALNWPHQNGRPAPSINGKGDLYWSTYAESYEVFKADGSVPDRYDRARTSLPPVATSALAGLNDPNARVLFNLSSTRGVNVLDEVNQAFAGPLWDQNGNMVHYEILLNRDEYDFVRNNTLYNLQGQVAYAAGHEQKVVFPHGSNNGGAIGAIELKLAWRILTATDIRSRYLSSDAYILTGNPAHWEKVVVGLVGMHIAHKTESSPQWIWSTFEHVDNLEVNDFAAFGHTKALPASPSFNDPGCEWCPVNVTPTADSKGVTRTQVTRVTPIPKATQALNAKWQATLAANKSPLQYYELINTQWPTDPSSPPAAKDQFPDAISNKSGGNPTPVFLVNSVMETYFQGGAGSAGVTTVTIQDEHGNQIPYAFNVAADNGGNTSARAMPGAVWNSPRDSVFATESCMGCHFSATISVSGSGPDPSKYSAGADLSGDFSWLLSQKAQPKK